MSINKKKIVIVVSRFPNISETFIVSKFLGLLDRGWDIHIVCNRISHEAWSLFPQLAENLKARERVHQTWPIHPRWLVPLLMIPALVYCLISAPRSTLRYLQLGWSRFGFGVFKRFYLDIPLIRLRPDILHFEFGSLAVGRTYLKTLLGCKLSLSFRGYDLNYIGLDQMDYYGDIWKTVDAVHFLGEDLHRRSLKRGAPKDLPFALIPPAIDLSFFPELAVRPMDKLGTAEHPLRILSVGRLHWKKGYEFNLQALRLLLDQGFNCGYEIIGDGDYSAPLYFARHQMGMEGVVDFLGGLPHAEVIDHLAGADIFLHGAVSEGFCNAALEAQAVGVPVVTSDADGLRENVQDGVTGFVVPRRDPQAMAEKLALLARDGELRRRMGAAGRKRVETHFRIEDQLDAFEAFYAQL